MKKKLKLPLLQMHKEIFEIISPEELKTILGGTYDTWESNEGFLNNVNYMISSGMFDYGGSGDFDSGFIDLGLGGSGSGGSNPGFGGFNFGSGNNGPSFINFYGAGSNPTTTMFSLGAPTGSGSNMQPGPLTGNFGSGGTASFTGNLNSQKLTYKIGNKTFTVEQNAGKIKVTFKVTF